MASVYAQRELNKRCNLRKKRNVTRMAATRGSCREQEDKSGKLLSFLSECLVVLSLSTFAVPPTVNHHVCLF